MASIKNGLPLAAMLLAIGLLTACGPLPGEAPLKLSFENSYSGDWDSSVKGATEALSLAEDDRIVFLSLSSRCECLIWKGDLDRALEDCTASIRSKPGYYGHPYANRARIFATQGNHAWALEEFDIAIDLGGFRYSAVTNNPRVVGLGGKARILAASPDETLRDGERALKFAQRAVFLENGVEQPAYKVLHRDTVAAAYAETGNFADAVKTQEDTIAWTEKNGWAGIRFSDTTLGQFLDANLQQLRSGKPIRGGAY